MQKTMLKALILGLVLIINFGIALAAETAPASYTPLAPIEGLTSVSLGGEGSSGDGLSQYIQLLYTWGVALTSGLAVIVIMWGGIGYMTSAGGGGIEEAKGRINAAILGLLLALGSYIILKTINADLLDTTFELATLNIQVENAGTVAPYVTTGGVPGSTPDSSGLPTLVTNADGTQEISISTPGLDTDGSVRPPFDDPHWSPNTSLGGLDSNKDVYVAVPNNTIPLGTAVTITNHTTGKSVNGIVGDHQGTAEQINSVKGKTAYGEISIAAANALGMNATSNSLPAHNLTIKYHKSK